jgi:hypothetical protein
MTGMGAECGSCVRLPRRYVDAVGQVRQLLFDASDSVTGLADRFPHLAEPLLKLGKLLFGGRWRRAVCDDHASARLDGHMAALLKQFDGRLGRVHGDAESFLDGAIRGQAFADWVLPALDLVTQYGGNLLAAEPV